MVYVFKLQVVSNIGVVTEGTTLMIITQVSSGFKKLHRPGSPNTSAFMLK